MYYFVNQLMGELLLLKSKPISSNILAKKNHKTLVLPFFCLRLFIIILKLSEAVKSAL